MPCRGAVKLFHLRENAYNYNRARLHFSQHEYEQALVAGDLERARSEAIAQVAEGADIIDVNVGAAGVNYRVLDVHLQSTAGHWTHGNVWSNDAQTSPCVDGGDPAAFAPGAVTLSPAGVETRYDLPKPGRHWCVHFTAPRGREPTTALPVLQVDVEVGCAWHDMQARVAASSSGRCLPSSSRKVPARKAKIPPFHA